MLPYVTPENRGRFIDTVRELRAVWLSNEAPGVVPGISAPRCPGGPFLLIRDGDTPLAYTDGHGAWVQWLAD